jgi:transposase
VSKSGDAAAKERARRRSWSASLKRQIVAETLEPGASVSVVARRHDVNANLVFTWRRQQAKSAPPPKEAPTTRLVPVRIAGDGAAAAGPTVEEAPAGMIEIELPGGIRVRVRGAVGLATLRQVLDLVRAR